MDNHYDRDQELDNREEIKEKLDNKIRLKYITNLSVQVIIVKIKQDSFNISTKPYRRDVMNLGITQDNYDKRSIKLTEISPIEIRSRFWIEYDNINIQIISTELRVDDKDVVSLEIWAINDNSELFLEYQCKKKGITVVNVMMVISDSNFIFEVDKQFSFIKYCNHVPIFSFRVGFHQVMTGKQASGDVVLNGYQNQEFKESLNQIDEETILDTYYASYNPNYQRYSNLFSSDFITVSNHSRFAFLQTLKIKSFYFLVQDTQINTPLLFINNQLIHTHYLDYSHILSYSFKASHHNFTNYTNYQQHCQIIQQNNLFKQNKQYQHNKKLDYDILDKIYNKWNSFIQINFEEEFLKLEKDRRTIDHLNNLKKIKELFQGFNETHKEDEKELMKIHNNLITQLDYVLMNLNDGVADQEELQINDENKINQIKIDQMDKVYQQNQENQDKNYLKNLLVKFKTQPKQYWPKLISIKTFINLIKIIMRMNDVKANVEKSTQIFKVQGFKYYKMLMTISDKVTRAMEQGGIDQYGARLIQAIEITLSFDKRYDSLSQMQAHLKELMNMNFKMRDSDVTMQRNSLNKEIIQYEFRDVVDIIKIEYNCNKQGTNKFQLVLEPVDKYMPFEPITIDFVKNCDGKLVNRLIDVGFKEFDNQISHGGLIGKPFSYKNPQYIIRSDVNSSVIFISISQQSSQSLSMQIIGPQSIANDYYTLGIELRLIGKYIKLSQKDFPELEYKEMLLLQKEYSIRYELIYTCWMIGMHKIDNSVRISSQYREVRFSFLKHCAVDDLFLNVYSYYPFYVFFNSFRDKNYFNYQYGDVVKHEGINPSQKLHTLHYSNRKFYIVSFNIQNDMAFYVYLRVKSDNRTRAEAYLPPKIYVSPRRYVQFTLHTYCYDIGQVNFDIQIQVPGYSNITFSQRRYCHEKDNYNFLVGYLFLIFVMILICYHIAIFLQNQFSFLHQHIQMVHSIGQKPEQKPQKHYPIARSNQKAKRLLKKYNSKARNR